ncbi:hypothetical protein [Streptomyces sp. NPDC057552]|uniref:hypothetical protein n=1 Tax=Streptomyces sp. NPDC057552 TaxID=3350537 RepID=UPI0036AE8763
MTGDGELGHPAAGPYDRIVATASVRQIPQPWLDRCVPDRPWPGAHRRGAVAARTTGCARGRQEGDPVDAEAPVVSG